MASDEVVKEAALHNHWAEKCVCWPNCSRCQTLAVLLDRMMAKGRLVEARWWHEMNDENNEELRRSQCCERVAELERQAGGAG